jgi:hypothetical protein
MLDDVFGLLGTATKLEKGNQRIEAATKVCDLLISYFLSPVAFDCFSAITTDFIISFSPSVL